MTGRTRDVREDLRRAGGMEASAPISTRRSTRRCTPARSRTRTASGPSRPSASTGSRRRPRSRTPRTLRDNVSIKWFEDGVINVAYNCIDRHLAKRGDQMAIIWEGDDPKDDKKITYRELHDEVCRFANILRKRNVKKGDRVTIYLPMIPEARLRDARLRAHRRGPLGGVRRLLARLARRPHRGLQVEGGHHRRRGHPRRPQDPAQGQYRRGDRQGGRRRPRDRRAPHRRRGRHGSGARRLVPRGRQDGDRRVPVRADERRGSAVHPLHVGLDRQAEGRAAHDRRLSRLRRDDAPVRVRLSRRRHLLVHRRRRLGHRPQLHRLRPARERRHHADVRRRAELSDACRASGR